MIATLNMPINGVSVTRSDGYVLCCVDEFTEELKVLIREELSAICNGKAEIQEYNLDCQSYEKTLAEFLTRYETKSEKMKKGIMGEFMAHLLINKVLTGLQALTILFNKEELNVKKGFDLVYVDTENDFIWYGEVKSGEVSSGNTPDGKNKDLLNVAKGDMRGFLSGQRSNVWRSVIVDVNLTIAQDQRKKVKDLLSADSAHFELGGDAAKNAVLISVLFHDVASKVSSASVEAHLGVIMSEKVFTNVILFSIQKSTYSRIEEFMRSEVQTI